MVGSGDVSGWGPLGVLVACEGLMSWLALLSSCSVAHSREPLGKLCAWTCLALACEISTLASLHVVSFLNLEVGALKGCVPE